MIKPGKAEGPSGIIVEMIKAGEENATAILELVNLIIYEENIPKDWKDYFIINCYKEKGDATDRGNYRGLKLLEHVIKVLERVLESHAWVQYYRCNIQPSTNAGETPY